MLQPLDISDRYIALIKDNIPLLHHRPVTCLEWGAGGSTLMIAKYLSGSNVPFQLLSIEHNPEWAERVKAEINAAGLQHSAAVKLIRCDGDPMREPMDEYVNHPFGMWTRFDFVFVDGRKRRRCLITASKLLNVGGVVLLHDAERKHYHSAFDQFTRQEFIGDKLWRGWIDDKLPAQ